MANERTYVSKAEIRKNIRRMRNGPGRNQCSGGRVQNSKGFTPHSFDRVLLDAPCSALGLRPRLFAGEVGKSNPVSICLLIFCGFSVVLLPWGLMGSLQLWGLLESFYVGVLPYPSGVGLGQSRPNPPFPRHPTLLSPLTHIYVYKYFMLPIKKYIYL